jgi:hypothetical protein
MLIVILLRKLVQLIEIRLLLSDGEVRWGVSDFAATICHLGEWRRWHEHQLSVVAQNRP